MNQILSFQNTANGKKIIQKNIRTMCIFFIMFAVVLIIEGAWKLYTNLNQDVDVDKPILVGHRSSDKTIFEVKSNIGIHKIIYSWNDGEESVIEKTGEKETSFEIDNRIGINVLKMRIVDTDGNSVTYDDIKVVYEEEEEDDGLRRARR